MQDTGILMPPGSGYLEMFRVTVPVTTIGYCDIHAAIVSTTEAPVTNSPNAGGTYMLEVGGVTYDIFRWHTLTKGAHFLSILHGTYDLPPTVTSFMFRVLGQCDIQSNSSVRGIHYRYDWSQIGALRT